MQNLILFPTHANSEGEFMSQAHYKLKNNKIEFMQTNSPFTK